MESVGIWHAADIYSEEKVSEVIGSRSNALSQIPAPRRIIISAGTGKRSEATTASTLFSEAITDILRKPVQWSSITNSVSSDPLVAHGAQLAGFEVSQATRSLQAAIEKDGKAVVLHDLIHGIDI